MVKCNNCLKEVEYTIRGICRKCAYPQVQTKGYELKNEIEKLIVKYEDKSLEEPAYYCQYVEFVYDLKSLLNIELERRNK